MSIPWIIIILAICVPIFIWIKIRQRKIDRGGWNELPEINKLILTATSKQQLDDAIESLSNIKKQSFDNQLLVGACVGLISLIEDKIEIDYPLSINK